MRLYPVSFSFAYMKIIVKKLMNNKKKSKKRFVKSATFVKSAVWPKAYPDPLHYPEIAVAGRSNVGKSSLINELTDRKQLARVSNTPGRTQLLNFFLINEQFTLCDLPGFGYAKVPLSVKKQWGQMMELYLTQRAPLRALLILMDIRRTPGEWEKDLVTLGSACGWGVIPIVTKSDKLSRSQQKPAIQKIAQTIGLSPKQLIPCSSLKGEGMYDIWRAMQRYVDTPYQSLNHSDSNTIDEEMD